MTNEAERKKTMSTADEAKQFETAVEEDAPKIEAQIEGSEIATEATEEDDGLGIDATYDDDVDESEDSLTFSNGVIEKIVALAMRDVPGVVGMKGGFINRVQDAFGVRDARRGVTVEVTPESAVRVNLAVFIAYGTYAPQVFEDVKHAVVDAISGMTGLEVAGVNLRIEDVLTEEEIEERTPKQVPAEEASEQLPEADGADVPTEAAEVDEAEELASEEAAE